MHLNAVKLLFIVIFYNIVIFYKKLQVSLIYWGGRFSSIFSSSVSFITFDSCKRNNTVIVTFYSKLNSVWFRL